MNYRLEIAFVKVLLPFTAGILLASSYESANYLKVALVSLTAILILLFLGNQYYQRLNLYRHKQFLSICFHFLFFLFGFSITLINKDDLKPDYFANANYSHLNIIINDEPQQTNGILRFVAKVKKANNGKGFIQVSGNLLVALKVDSLNPLQLKYGDELWITAKYEAVEPPYNPAEFDFKAWLAVKNIFHQTFINQSQTVLVNHHQGNFIKDFAINLRQQQVNVYRKIIKNDEAFAVASTLILGYRADLSKETLSAYSKTGTIHALSVSGMHVGLIYIILNWILASFDGNRKSRFLKFLIITSLIWYYSLITGLSPSVTRSAIMLTAFMLSKLFNRQQNSYNIIAFTALCILINDPFLIYDVGFQLSFLAVLGLIYLQPKICNWIFIKNKFGDQLWQTTAMSISAQLATFPLSIYYFHQFPIYFLIANLFIFIPIILLMYVGLVILIFHTYLSSWFNWLNWFFEWLIILVNDVLKWIAELPFAGITSIWINKFELILLSVMLFMFIYAVQNYHKKLLWTSLVLALCFQSFGLYQKIQHENQSKIVFFSLRKNYASAYIDGRTTVIITDLKLEDKNFEFFVKPALDQMQVTDIKFIKWEENAISGNFIKINHQIWFKKHLTFLYSDSIFNKKILNYPSFDAVWLHRTAKLKLETLNHQVKYNMLIIDASNKDYHINKYKTAAKNINLDAVVLKKSKALILHFDQ